MQLSPPGSPTADDGDDSAPGHSRPSTDSAAQLIGGAASALVWVELLGMPFERLSFPATAIGSVRVRWGRVRLCHLVLTALFYCASRLLAQWHAAAIVSSGTAHNGGGSQWGSRSKLLLQVATVLHLAELPHLYYRT